MTTITRAKLILALIGVIVFAAGIRMQEPRLRYVGIGFVAAAWVLRFVRSRATTAPPDETA